MRIEDFVEIALEHLDRFGLTESGWTIVTNDRIHRILGQCNYDDKVLVFSEKHIEQSFKSQVLDTLLHECGHALVAPHHGHDEVWQRKAIELGASPKPYAEGCFINKRKVPLLKCSRNTILV